MGNHDLQHSGVRGLLYRREHFANQRGPKGRGDLVEQQDLRFRRHGAGDANAMLLAAEDLVGQVEELIAKNDAITDTRFRSTVIFQSYGLTPLL